MNLSHIQALIKQNLEESQQVSRNFMNNPENLEQIALASKKMADAIQRGNKIMSCGNGGSHCDAMHFAEELSGRYRENRKALAAISISDASHITCTANDYGFDFIFSRMVEALGQPGDILLGISTSGNSKTLFRPWNRPESVEWKWLFFLERMGVNWPEKQMLKFGFRILAMPTESRKFTFR
jgi:D-sedoheptulose 7-phosphate isomerase